MKINYQISRKIASLMFSASIQGLKFSMSKPDPKDLVSSNIPDNFLKEKGETSFASVKTG